MAALTGCWDEVRANLAAWNYGTDQCCQDEGSAEEERSRKGKVRLQGTEFRDGRGEKLSRTVNYFKSHHKCETRIAKLVISHQGKITHRIQPTGFLSP